MLSDLIDKVLSQEEEHEPSGKLAPSALYGCDRKAIFRQRKTPPTVLPDARTRRVFAMGDAVEKFVLDALNEAGVVFDRDVKVENNSWNGAIDAVIQDPRWNTLHVLEVKSVHSKAFWWNQKESKNGILGLGQGMPYDAHIYQALAYHLLHANEDYGDPHILYVSKDDLAMEEFIVSRREGNIEAWKLIPEWPNYETETVAPVKLIPDDLEERMATLQKYALAGEIPPIPFATSDEHAYLCEKKGVPACPFFAYCWGGRENS